jgi:hypothetical protein
MHILQQNLLYKKGVLGLASKEKEALGKPQRTARTSTSNLRLEGELSSTI